MSSSQMNRSGNDAPIVERPAAPLEERHVSLLSLSPSLAQKRLALAVVLALAIAFVITAWPLSSIQLPRIDAFIPAYAAAMFVIDLITATLLFAQFSILHSRALLVIASGYLFTALILIPWILTFQGVFAPEGLLGAGLQSTSWLYTLWHASFPLFVLGYALLKDADRPRELWKGPGRAVILSSMAVIAGVCAATFVVTADSALLPRLLDDDMVHFSVAYQYAAASMVLLIIAVIIVLWLRLRTVLDLWLIVVLCADAIEIILISFPVPARYTVGWYAGRVFGFVSGSLVLCVLLYEITTLYARLLRAVLAQRREREARLVTGNAVAVTIAHEVKQPLSAMVTNAFAGLRLLDRRVPDLDETKAALRQIAADGRRTGEVINSIRAMFKSDVRDRTSRDINELINEALVLLRSDLQKHQIFVQSDPSPKLPQVRGDRIQLQQVLLNLIANAIDSMAGEDGPRVLSVRSEVQDGSIIVSVADTGAGISPQDVDRIFNPLFTTKSEGMGMGLSICRSIIEAHDGRLWVAPNKPRGALFQFVLPVAAL